MKKKKNSRFITKYTEGPHQLTFLTPITEGPITLIQ